MKIKKIALVLITTLFIYSCKDESKNEENVVKIKTFGLDKDDTIMLHSSYPNESVRWDKLVASFNNLGDGISNSSFVINFKTENFFCKHKIDSAFVVLKPYPEENFGANQLKIALIDEPFKADFSWNNKPIVYKDIYSLYRNKDNKDEKKIKIDITNLVKYSSSEYKFDLPLIFSLKAETLSEQAFATFYSSNIDIDEVKPKLEVYYSK
ncbi:DNRLRE domain-containing protein [Flavobacterium sediminilitoris]|uniref:DNRLRE domain-containing protein n=1 Tax=Flavobacterium sediminilitoris TaxID=2024526 RepID=A0ABY4HQQ3_9FLAO|nr:MULTISPECIES: DNRLRE domain-containing protein [Flavobacterium]UOX34940.1 DNRLRE domain-containing protein [Flavobacterium sediminilitoris]